MVVILFPLVVLFSCDRVSCLAFKSQPANEDVSYQHTYVSLPSRMPVTQGFCDGYNMLGPDSGTIRRYGLVGRSVSL